MPNETTKIKIVIDNVSGLITWEGLDFNVSVPATLNIIDWDERTELDRAASVHGIKQKVNDARAGITEAKGNTLEDMRDVMNEVIDHIAAGQWNKTKEGSKGKSISMTVAISKMKELGKDEDEIREQLDWMFPTIDLSTIRI